MAGPGSGGCGSGGGVGGLFYAYLLQSRVLPTDADGAGNALQAWDMLHGNILLSGWSLSDVSFYTTELPEYMLVELVRGLNADVVHVAAAITYTLVGVLAMVLAIGRATGREAALRALVVAAIMLAPALGTASGVLPMAWAATGRRTASPWPAQAGSRSGR